MGVDDNFKGHDTIEIIFKKFEININRVRFRDIVNHVSGCFHPGYTIYTYNES